MFEMLNREVGEREEKKVERREFVKGKVGGGEIKNGEGMGGKYEKMGKWYGGIGEYWGVDKIEGEKEEEKEGYEWK